MKQLPLITLILIIIGGLNWLLVGAFQFDLVVALFGSMPALVTIVYIVVGLAAIHQLFLLIQRRS